VNIAPATRALARLAWREQRRRPGRFLLVIALVALPVAALVVAAVLNASSVATPEDHRANLMAGADVVVQFAQDDTTNGDTADDVLRRLPRGSRVVRVRERVALVPERQGDVFVEMSDLPLADPLSVGKTKMLRGRPPVGPGEIAASSVALHDLGLHVGDTLVSRRLGLSARVTAEIVDADNLSRSLVISGAPLAPASSRTARLLLSVAPGTAASAAAALRGPGREVRTVADCCPDERPAAREMLFAVSGLALFVVGLVVAAAFAVGARRQLRLIGLLSVAAGADERHVRRLAVLQGTLCGGVGVVAGFALGLAVLKLFIAPNLDDIAGRLTGGLTFAPVELALIAAMALVATAVGAWRPGRTAARIPVVAALGGRNPLRAVPATLPVRALATSALGTALLAIGLNGGGPHGLTLAGAVLIVLGFVLCAPALVAVLERLASRARGVTRLAAREVARQRTRTGPLVAAILAVASLAVLGSTLIGAVDAFQTTVDEIRSDQVLLSASGGAAAQRGDPAVPAPLRARVRALLPGSTQAEFGFYEPRVTDALPERAAALGPSGGGPPGMFGLAIGGPELLEFLGAGAGRAAFDRGEVVALTPGVVDGGHVRIRIPQAHGRPREVRVAASEVRADGPIVAVVIPTAAAARLGLTPTTTDVVFRTPKALTAAQERALQAEAISYDRGSAAQADTEIRFAGNLRRQGGLSRGVHAALLAIAALLTLAVVAAGLALSAAEGRADDTTLVALGADPATRRRLRATQAGLLVAIGGLLALPAGLIPATVIILESSEMRFVVPWTAVAVVLVALPAAAAAGAWLLTRPARWSAPTTWAD
jgi:putative ABC transport system permease protein